MQQEVRHRSVIENVINSLPPRVDLPGGQLSVFLVQLMLASLIKKNWFISNATPMKELILLWSNLLCHTWMLYPTLQS